MHFIFSLKTLMLLFPRAFQPLRCCVVLELQLLPLLNRRKLQVGEQTGAKMPVEPLGEVVLKLTLPLGKRSH